MRTAADVSTDELIDSLLQSVNTGSPHATDSASEPSKLAANASVASSSASPSKTPPSDASVASSSASQSKTPSSDANSASIPATKAPSPPSPAALSPATASDLNPETVTGATSDDDDDGAGLSIGLAVGISVFVIAALLFLWSRRNRTKKKRNSVSSPATPLTVPAHRGFKKEEELGMPEMSIELSPGDLGLSKGFDVSYASSTRTSTASNQFNASNASSTDSSVFNTRGGLSPTFSSRKMASYSYHYRDSEENNPHLASSTLFHLTGLIGNGQASGRGGNLTLSRAPGGRKLSAPDEYAELVTATNAHDKMDMESHNQSLQADFTQSATSHNELDRSMGPDDNHSFLAPLPTRAAPAPTHSTSTVPRASEESMGPDSPVNGHGRRTGPVHDSIPNLSDKKASVLLRRSEEDLRAMSIASFLSESSIASTSTRDSIATTACGSAYVSSVPSVLQVSSADDGDYGEDNSSDRASTESSDSTNTARPGSLIALNLEAKGGSSEIAI